MRGYRAPMFLLAHLGLTVLAARMLPGRVRWDYRAVLVGAVLPDLLDKPLGYLVLPLERGRLVGHTALFVLLLLALAWVAGPRPTPGRRTLESLAFGSSTHLVLDGMALEPSLLLWPVLGTAFPGDPYPPSRWVAAMHEPFFLLTETAGAVALAWFFVRHGLGEPTRWRRFVDWGEVETLAPRAGAGRGVNAPRREPGDSGER